MEAYEVVADWLEENGELALAEVLRCGHSYELRIIEWIPGNRVPEDGYWSKSIHKEDFEAYLSEKWLDCPQDVLLHGSFSQEKRVDVDPIKNRSVLTLSVNGCLSESLENLEKFGFTNFKETPKEE